IHRLLGNIIVCDVQGVSMSERGTTPCLVEKAGEDSIFLVACMGSLVAPSLHNATTVKCKY
ncbi:unnamed protein product, partial [Ectocarpus sp. 12 AP-2014]